MSGRAIITTLVGCAIQAGYTANPPLSTDGGNRSKSSAQKRENLLPKWEEGMLDIHHINTGRGNSAFAIFPDGTTMLIDAGPLRDDWGQNYTPLELAPARPNNSRRPGEWIVDYIEQFAPADLKSIDYALITHFHGDHFGVLGDNPSKSIYGNWQLTGISDIAEVYPINQIFDRGFPSYKYPLDLRKTGNSSLQNYLKFVGGAIAAGRLKGEKFDVGNSQQIRLKRNATNYPSFAVHNIAGNGIVAGLGSQFGRASLIGKDGRFNENPLSLVIKISYGNFDYVTGGDFTGVSEPDHEKWFDLETIVSQVIGEADVATDP